MVQWLILHFPMQESSGSIPGGGAKIPHALWPKNQNRSNVVINSIKTLKMSHIKKKSYKKISRWRDFPGGQVCRTPCFHCKGCWLDPCLRKFRKPQVTATTTTTNSRSLSWPGSNIQHWNRCGRCRWSEVARMPKMKQEEPYHREPNAWQSLHFDSREVKQTGAGLHLDKGRT